MTTRSGAAARSRGDGRVDEVDDVDLAPLERTLLVEPGEQEQVVDEHAHPDRLGLDPPDRGTALRPRR